MRFLYNVCASQKSGHGCTEEATITTKSNVEAAARHVWAADSSIVGMGTQKKKTGRDTTKLGIAELNRPGYKTTHTF